MALKSILKKSKPAPPDTGASNERYTDRHRELALHHANLLQQRKDAESQILTAIEALLEFPVATTDASQPVPSDVARFRDLLTPFSATDYDDLIEERSLAEKCGYALCPNAPKPRPAAAKSKFRLDFSNGGVSKIANDQQQVWCSKACAKRAMYIRVQLSEVPAWERVGGYGGRLEILQEDDVGMISKKMQDMDISVTEEQRMQKAMEALALERGEKADSSKLKLVMTEDVLENRLAGTTSSPDAPSLSTESVDGIEGYTSKFGASLRQEPS